MANHHSTTWDTSAAADGDLITGALAGEGFCFDELVKRYHRPIASFIFRMIGNRETALDLTQDVFIKVYGSLDRYRPEFKFSTWIYKIASNTAIDHLRKASLSTSPLYFVNDEEEVELQIPAKGPSPERALQRSERRAQIEEVIAQLPPRYRELILLRDPAATRERARVRRDRRGDGPPARDGEEPYLPGARGDAQAPRPARHRGAGLS
jgi:RNA polymerase sigma-70 factor, ECF subfamily